MPKLNLVILKYTSNSLFLSKMSKPALNIHVNENDIRSRYVAILNMPLPSFQRTALSASDLIDHSAKVITRAVRMHYLKTGDAKLYPTIFKRHALLSINKMFGQDRLKEDLRFNQLKVIRDNFGNKMHMHLRAKADPKFVKKFFNELKQGKGLNVYGTHPSMFESARVAFIDYKEFIGNAKLTHLIAFSDDAAIPAVEFVY